MVIARSGRILGSIFVADEIRAEAPAAVAALRHLGIRTVLLTGDARPVAESVARTFGVDEVDAELLPTEKVDAMISSHVRATSWPWSATASTTLRH